MLFCRHDLLPEEGAVSNVEVGARVWVKGDGPSVEHGLVAGVAEPKGILSGDHVSVTIVFNGGTSVTVVSLEDLGKTWGLERLD